MPKPIKDAYDPTDTQQTHDILTSIVNKEQSRIRQINLPEESQEPTCDISGNTAVQQYSNTEAQPHNSNDVLTENYIKGDSASVENVERNEDKGEPDHQSNTPSKADVPAMAKLSEVKSRTKQENPRSTSRNTAIQQYYNTEVQPHGSNIEVLINSPDELLVQVRQQRATEVITLRIPYEMDEWLEDYVHAHRKEGCKKQEVVAWAVMLLRQELDRADR